MKTPRILLRLAWPALLTLALANGLSADIPTVLTDKIYRGGGVINLLKNTTGAQLSQYIAANGRLLLGVDVNEDNSGDESNTSQGLAIKDVQLLITTNQGTFSFSDIFTNTTALLTESGSATARTYNTLFGQGGSSQITGSTSGFDLSKYDDVLELRNVAVSGVIQTAELVVQFLDTGSNKKANEAFFDFSGGFEDFALLAPKDAQILEAAAIGIVGTGSSLTYSTTTVAPTYYTEPSPTATSPTTTSPTTTVSTTTSSTTTATAPITTTSSPTTTTVTTTTSPTTTTTSPITTTASATTTTVTTTTAPTTSVVLSAPGAPAPPLVLLLGSACLALVASARERFVRRA